MIPPRTEIIGEPHGGLTESWTFVDGSFDISFFHTKRCRVPDERVFEMIRLNIKGMQFVPRSVHPIFGKLAVHLLQFSLLSLQHLPTVPPVAFLEPRRNLNRFRKL
jgi:hypothetical protein